MAFAVRIGCRGGVVNAHDAPEIELNAAAYRILL